MKAVRYRSYGDSGVLVYEDADRPVAGAGQVVVKMAGAAFNPVDVAIRCGASCSSPEETAALADLTADGGVPAVHDQAAAGRLAGKTVLTP